ncbi:bifunctional UDP-sugar hydrolase/5'-nucleotidase [Nostocoides sp. HKS02]|uniref:bifunctional metallophosphatase/5'-nucleotidase n=1 Tax=Nostocoides sp. HKS02 TaxID=1813880 RepID=UPI0012B4EF8A|nr:5'-nucleotidase C-terminal domain-containing protein [Tetrasphaera sp. HKS02]QGN56825.1 bifunctional metallophosphatase/5'-nucleotidase [Tetrasphaera sp. HKS02]
MPATRTVHPPPAGGGRSRRDVLTMAVVGGAGAAAAFFAPVGSAQAAQEREPGSSPRRTAYRITVMGTTDLHGTILNWDYFQDAEYDDPQHNDVGLAKIATLVAAVRAERGADRTLLLDAGDLIQGSPLAQYYATIAPLSEGSVHPMAMVMNQLRYDAAALGNHEFSFGVDTLRAFAGQCAFPLLSANTLDWVSGAPAFAPYLIRTFAVPGVATPLTVGVLGLVTPGVALWERDNVEGQLRFGGVVEQAQVWVPRLKKAGCDVVVVACHSGATPGSSYGAALPFPENAATQLAQQVAGVDAVLVGHAEEEIPERFVASTVTPGRKVLLTEPLRWGMRLSVMDLDVLHDGSAWHLTKARAHLLNANTVDEDPVVAELVRDDHAVVRTYMSSVIGSCTVALSTATARFEHTAALDFINSVQADTVKDALSGTPDESLPVLSATAPLSRAASIPTGDVTVRDVAGLYPDDATLLGIRLTGGQLKDYLEHSAAYFSTIGGRGPFAPDDVTGAASPKTGAPIPDQDYDVVGGLDTPLSYDLDLTQPVGQRVVNLRYAGEPIDPAAAFVVAISSHRQSGAGGFPGVTTAPVVYNAQVEIRQLIIDWVTEQGSIDPAAFTTNSWRLVAGTDPVVVR